MRGLTIGATLLAVAAAGCKNKPDASYDGVPLPQARGVREAPDGPTLVVRPDATSPEVPAGAAGGILRLAIDRHVHWKDVDALLKKVEAAGAQAVPLVGQRWHLRAFSLSDDLEAERSIAVTATLDGKTCVSPPDVPEAKCVQTIEKNHVDVAYTRELVREAVNEYKIYDVNLQVDPEMQWQDVVRAIDGARTCCYDVPVRVKLNR
jgi:biopolymer transport protein ExbD